MASGSIPIRIITLNIRVSVARRFPGEEPWAVRCPKLCAQLRFITFGHPWTFVCLQEATYPQLLDIKACLGPDWSHIGGGRDDGKKSGEFCPILFRPDHWVCERDATVWLSQTPEVVSRGWDASLNRIVTMGCFNHRTTGASTIVMNTHLDHSGVVAREESTHLLLKLAKGWAGENGTAIRPPLFLTGDFNSGPDSKVYRTLTAPGSGFKDISELVPKSLRYGHNEITYTSFGQPGEKPCRIDFIFVLEPERLNFLTFGILPNRFDDMVYLTDHRPVVADIGIPIGRHGTGASV